MSSWATERPTAPAPAITTRISLASGPASSGGVRLFGAVLAHEQAEEVTLLDDGVCRGDQAGAKAGEVGDAYAGRLLELVDAVADPAERSIDRVEPDIAGLVAPRGLGARGHESAKHLIGSPGDCRDRGHAEAFVDLCATRVVDPCDDGLDLELLAGDSRGDDVGVVTAGHRGEAVGTFDASLD